MMNPKNSLLAQSYKIDNFLWVKACISDEKYLSSVLISSRSLASRRVVCGDSRISWSEQAVPENHPLHLMFLSDDITQKILCCIDNDRLLIQHTRCWISTYRLNEFIGHHKDNDGDFQVIIALAVPPSENGGILCLRMENVTINLPILAGDAVFFKATKIEHFTTPLVSSLHLSNPERIIAVCRYWFS